MMQRHTRIKPMSDKRRAELAEAGIRWPNTTLIVLPGAAASRASSDPDWATVAACLKRDGCACIRCLAPLVGRRGFDWSIHHRVRRSQGGDNRLSNLVSLCGSGTTGCHGRRVHAAPAAARAVGLLLRRGDDPAAARLLYAGTWRRLTDDGRVIEP